MCDCYYHRCKVCGEYLPVHLGDYDTNRDEIEVFCGKHIPDTDVKIFILREKSHDTWVPRNITEEENQKLHDKYMKKYDDIDVLKGEKLPDSWDKDYKRWAGKALKRVLYPVGWKMGIRYLTDNARNHELYNHPNIGVEWDEVYRIKGS